MSEQREIEVHLTTGAPVDFQVGVISVDDGGNLCLYRASGGSPLIAAFAAGTWVFFKEKTVDRPGVSGGERVKILPAHDETP